MWVVCSTALAMTHPEIAGVVMARAAGATSRAGAMSRKMADLAAMRQREGASARCRQVLAAARRVARWGRRPCGGPRCRSVRPAPGWSRSIRHRRGQTPWAHYPGRTRGEEGYARRASRARRRSHLRSVRGAGPRSAAALRVWPVSCGDERSSWPGSKLRRRGAERSGAPGRALVLVRDALPDAGWPGCALTPSRGVWPSPPEMGAAMPCFWKAMRERQVVRWTDPMGSSGGR